MRLGAWNAEAVLWDGGGVKARLHYLATLAVPFTNHETRFIFIGMVVILFPQHF